MQKNEFAEIFNRLANYYNDRLVKPGMSPQERAWLMEDWYVTLRDLPVELVQAAVLEFRSSPSAFPPTAGQIRDKAMNLTKRGNRIPSAAEAWEEILTAPADGKVMWSETNEGENNIYIANYNFNHPLVEKVARNLGWPDKFWTDKLGVDRAKFMQVYEQEERRATQEITSLPEVRDYIGRMERTGSSDIQEITAGFRREALDRGE